MVPKAKPSGESEDLKSRGPGGGRTKRKWQAAPFHGINTGIPGKSARREKLEGKRRGEGVARVCHKAGLRGRSMRKRGIAHKLKEKIKWRGRDSYPA